MVISILICIAHIICSTIELTHHFVFDTEYTEHGVKYWCSIKSLIPYKLDNIVILQDKYLNGYIPISKIYITSKNTMGPNEYAISIPEYLINSTGNCIFKLNYDEDNIKNNNLYDYIFNSNCIYSKMWWSSPDSDEFCFIDGKTEYAIKIKKTKEKINI